jgi:hypothetical protein
LSDCHLHESFNKQKNNNIQTHSDKIEKQKISQSEHFQILI